MSTRPSCILTADETTLFREIEDPKLELPRNVLLRVSAAAVRAFVLQQPVELPSRGAGWSPDVRVAPISVTGITIKGCLIEGALDLRQARPGDGDALPPLCFMACIFLGSIDLSYAKFRSLAFQNSYLTELLGVGLDVEGDFDLEGIVSVETAPEVAAFRPPSQPVTGYSFNSLPIGLASVSLNNARVRGSVKCNSCNLSMRKDDDGQTAGRPRRYAFTLNGAAIEGNLWLQKSFLQGGMDAGGLRLGGDLVVNSSFFFPPAEAVYLSSARISGTVFLRGEHGRGPTWINGVLNLNQAEIGKNLFINGATLKPGACGHSIHADSLCVGGDADFSPMAAATSGGNSMATEFLGKVQMRRGRLGGDFRLNGLLFREEEPFVPSKLGREFLNPERTLETLVEGEELTIRQELLQQQRKLAVDRRDVVDLLDLTGTSVTGVFAIRLSLMLQQHDNAPYPRYPRLNLSGVKVGSLDDDLTTGLGPEVRLVVSGFLSSVIPGWETKIFNVVSNFKLKVENGMVSKAIAEVLWLYLLPVLAIAAAVNRHFVLASVLFGTQTLVLAFFGVLVSTPDDMWRNVRKTIAFPVTLLFGLGDRLIYHRAFLNRQYYDPKHPYLDEFSPGVYDSLAKQLREDGREEDSRAVLSEKLRIQRKVSVPWYAVPFLWLYDLCFGHGFSAPRALITLGICLLVGTLGIRYADSSTWPHPHQPLLVVATSTVNTLAVYNQDQSTLQPSAQPYAITLQKSTDPKARPPGEIFCGARIDPLLYATELFVPALDLHQTSVCEFSAGEEARGWRAARALYTILGWIVISITVLTVPGILRRRAEQ